MKRANHQIEAIAAVDNLRLAFVKARRGKIDKNTVLYFRDNLDAELVRLRQELLTGLMMWGPYHTFKVFDPKERVICAAPFYSRVAQHAIIGVCAPVFERYQIFDSYACRKEKGLHAALARAIKFSRSGGWHMKMDIRKYFDSMDHDVLRELLFRHFKDRVLLGLFDSIISSYCTSPGKGIPIGNLTSQYFANHYLALLDHYIKEKLRLRCYLRYMDDFVVWSSSKANLIETRKQIESFLRERLKLEMKPVHLNACNRGMTFLGFRVFPCGARLARSSRERFRRKAVHYARMHKAGIWDETQLARHMEPLLAFVRNSASRAFRERVMNTYGLCPEDRIA